MSVRTQGDSVVDGTLTAMVAQVASDSKRLVSDEVRLARLEIDEVARASSRGLATLSDSGVRAK